MTELNKEYVISQVKDITGITERNIKFWCSIYNLNPLKKGRNNYYSEKLVNILQIINFLSKTKYFTQKLIKVIVDYYCNETNEVDEEYNNFVVFINRFFSENKYLSPLNFNFLDLKSFEKFKNYQLDSISENQESPDEQLKNDFLL